MCRGLFYLLVSIHERFDTMSKDVYSRVFQGPLCMLSMELCLSSWDSEEVSSLGAAGEKYPRAVFATPRTNRSPLKLP